MHWLNRLRRVSGEGAAGSVAPTDGSWQGKGGSTLGSLDHVQEQIGGGQGGRGETGRRACGSETLLSPSPRARTRDRRERQHHDFQPPVVGAGPQVHAFVQNWRAPRHHSPASHSHRNAVGLRPASPANAVLLANAHVVTTCSKDGAVHCASLTSLHPLEPLAVSPSPSLVVQTQTRRSRGVAWRAPGRRASK